MREAAQNAGVQIVTGDTKVVEKGSCDGMFINTAGIGVVATDLRLSADRARPGDVVLLSGPIGDHGIAILAEREGLSFETDILSDSAPLHSLVADMLATGAVIRCMRDPTRAESPVPAMKSHKPPGSVSSWKKKPFHCERRCAEPANPGARSSLYCE